MPCGEGTVRHTEEKWVEESVCKVVCLRKTYPKNRYPLYYYVLFIHAVASLGYQRIGIGMDKTREGRKLNSFTNLGSGVHIG